MGILATLLSFTKVIRRKLSVYDVKTDAGGGFLLTGEHFGSPGDDSRPLPSDTVVLMEIPRNGGVVSIAYLDPNNTQKASQGDKRVYGRNASGTEVNQLWLKSDGECRLENDLGSATMALDGAWSVVGPVASWLMSAAGLIKAENAVAKLEINTAGDIQLINAVATIDAKNNGTIEMQNANGSYVLDPDGTTTIKQDTTEVIVEPGGTITLKNDVGSFEIQPSGDIVINGVTITPAGIVSTAGAIISGTTVLGTHTHTGVTSGPSNTGPPA